MMKEESFLTCVLQWSIVSLFLFFINRIYIKKYHESWKLLGTVLETYHFSLTIIPLDIQIKIP